jgi:non-ribosomal peptide synthetase-like protein
LDVPPGADGRGRIQISYAALDRQADALAGFLRGSVSEGSIVAIVLSRRSGWICASQLAVLKAGAAHLCIDPSFPDERIRDLLDDSEAVTVLTDAPGLERLRRIAPLSARLVDVTAPVEPVAGDGTVHRAPSWLGAASLAYVIYTSGTTGRPKGVLIEHRGIVNLIRGDLAEFQLGPGDRVAQSSSAAYDSSVEETWMALAAGATVVVMDEDASRLGPDLIPWLRRERITVFCPPPTLLRATGCVSPESELPDLKLVYVGGEALPDDVVERWAPGRRLVNGYGPTECSVTSLRTDVVKGDVVTIGAPVPGLSAWVLDETGSEVSGGARGELFLGGIGLARGYWKRPELTAEKFIQHPKLGRLYRTGDQVHRDEEGRFHYHGRIDSQVKIRGYRIELEEIEARLVRCAGVRAAACRAQEDHGSLLLVAFVVPEDPSSPPDVAMLRSALGGELPAYMVPARFGVLNELPATVGGKLNRAALPRIEGGERAGGRSVILPSNSMEAAIETAFRDCLRWVQPISVHDDFFTDLGGDSLRAALLVSLLRERQTTAWVTVRELYQARTIAELAKRSVENGSTGPEPDIPVRAPSGGRPLLVTVVQAAWLLGASCVASWVGYFGCFDELPRLITGLGPTAGLLCAPLFALAGFLIYTAVSFGFAVGVKRLLIGRYRAIRAPVWGGFFLRNWIVQRAVGLVPWRAFDGTWVQIVMLRALGATIGNRVHIDRGVDLLQGGWDLLTIGDDVSLGRDAEIRLVELEDGQIVMGAIKLGDGATLEIRSGVGGDTEVEAGGCLTPLSSLAPGGRIPRGELWDGIPARRLGRAPMHPSPPTSWPALTEGQYGIAVLLARAGGLLFAAFPIVALALIISRIQGLVDGDIWAWILNPSPDWAPVEIGMGLVVAAVPLWLTVQAMVARGMGTVPEGDISRWSFAYLRVRLKIDLVESAGLWLSGTLFWPVWLRWAGMRVGVGCEISTIIGVVPEQIEIGAQTFLADGIYLGGPRIHQGVVTLSRTRLGRNTFLGNHVVIPGGQNLPDDVLLGVCTVADDRQIRPGTSWFGLPPFELPRREVVEMDRGLTHEPSWIRYANRVFWELLRFTLPVTPLLVLIVWVRSLAWAEGNSGPALLLILVPLLTLGLAGFQCLVVLLLKWTLLGRVKAGQHALWSCWCSRWDFLYVAWGQYAAPILSHLEGTLLLAWYLRAMGMQIGKRVVLGPGFAQVVDPDMIHIEDEATVSATYQAHTFEDRVLKIDHVYVRRGATLGSNTVPLYGADVGEHAYVAPHSVIMKRERLLAGTRYEGAPTR